MGIVQIVTGVFLVWSVFKIRAFFKSRNDVECIDTRSLMYHAVSFVLYLATTILYYTAGVMYAINYDRLNRFLISVIIWRFGNLISLLLLSVILWRLGEKDEEEDMLAVTSALNFVAPAK